MSTKETAPVVFMVNLKSPLRPIREVKVRLVNRKWCWAEDLLGRRHLVGASAFFTRKGAERAKFAILTKYEKDSWLRRWKPDVHNMIKEQLKKYKETGVMA